MGAKVGWMWRQIEEYAAVAEVGLPRDGLSLSASRV
jgi:hypothetical protein